MSRGGVKIIKKIIVVIIFFASLSLIYHYDQIMTGIGVYKMPDMLMGFHVTELLSILNKIRDKVQISYLQFLCIDCIFTVSFAILQNGILRYVMRMPKGLQKFQFTLRLAPLRAGFDLAENVIFALLLIGPWSVWSFGYILVEVVTNIKFFMLGMWLLSVVSLFVAGLLMKLRRKRIG